VDEQKIKKLMEAQKKSREKLVSFRKFRMEHLQHFVGSRYSQWGAKSMVPLPLLTLAVTIYTRKLVPQQPSVLCTTKNKELKPTAESLGLAIDRWSTQTDFALTLENIIMDAMFSIGVAKVGLNKSQTVEIGGFLHDYGQPYCDHVSIDDLVLDMTAKKYEEMQYIGDKYRIRKQDALECGLFKEDVINRITAGNEEDTKSDYDYGEESADQMQKGDEGVEEGNLYDYIELIDFWLPMESKLVTVPACGSPMEAAREEEYDGPETGPYEFLRFINVPDNFMPLPPVSIWIQVAELCNVLYEKLGRQAKRQKKFGVIEKGHNADGQKSVEVADGELVGIQGSTPKEMSLGGPDQVNLAFMLASKDLFSYIAGNIDTMGGLSPQAETLGQEEILTSQSSEVMRQMASKVVGFERRVLGKVGKYMWEDPLIKMPIIKRVPGTSIEVPTFFDAAAKDGRFEDYSVDIQPYSMQDSSPESRINDIMKILMQVYVPLAPMMQQQGILPDWNELMALLAKYKNIPELNQLFLYSDAAVVGQQGPTGPQTPAVKRTINERVNRPGATQQGKTAALMQTLLGGNPQQSEMAGIGRPTS